MTARSIMNKSIGTANGRRASTGRLLCEFTFVFAIFFAVVLSPFWVYGKSFLWKADGMTQYYSELVFTRNWVKTILASLREGRLEIPLWSPWIGLGQGTLSTVIHYRPLNFLYCLFPYDALEQYLTFRMVVGMYLSGLSFIVFARTRTRNRACILLGCMIYLFSGFILFYATRHWVFLELTMAMPLMLLGVDQVFDGKWSWLFVLVVFVMAMCYFYTLYMVTIPAVIYAIFHYFELSVEERNARGGLGRILLRHVVQGLTGIALAAVNMMPCIFAILESSRTSAQKGVNLLFWKPTAYLDYILGIVDADAIIDNGYIALPSAALVGILALVYTRRKRDRLLLGQIILYTLAFMIPALTMVFSAFAGKTLRWSYAFTFWTAICTACLLPRLRRSGPSCFRFCVGGFVAYTVIYLCVGIWKGDNVSISLVTALLGLVMLYVALVSDWGTRRKRLATLLLFAVLLVELTAKSYERFSPQYDARIAAYANAGTVMQRARDNAADILDKVSDDGDVYRVDVAMDRKSDRIYLTNYGTRDQVNGVSSYYNLNSERMAQWSTDLGNSHMEFRFMMNDLAQRTVLDALAGVKYVAVLKEGLNRVPYGYTQIANRKKTLSDGSTTTEHLFENQYALPLAYAYEQSINSEKYAALPPNRKEQAMLQGVVLESESPLQEAELRFDDQVMMDSTAIHNALAKIAEKDANLTVADGLLRVKKNGYSVSIPIEPAEGEIYLQFRGLHYRSVNYYKSQAASREKNGLPRIDVMESRRSARQWRPIGSAAITAACGAYNDETDLLGEDQQYYYGPRDVLLNLGYGAVSDSLKLTFSVAGEYSFDSVSLICQPMDTYEAKIDALRAHGATSMRFDGNRVEVGFDLDNDAMACLAIPYSGGWTAQVDGKPAEIVPANGLYMGVMLSKGTHTVVFSYIPKGLRLGIALSLCTLVALALGTVICTARRRRRNAAVDD